MILACTAQLRKAFGKDRRFHRSCNRELDPTVCEFDRMRTRLPHRSSQRDRNFELAQSHCVPMPKLEAGSDKAWPLQERRGRCTALRTRTERPSPTKQWPVLQEDELGTLGNKAETDKRAEAIRRRPRNDW